jgi:hypothetical protein
LVNNDNIIEFDYLGKYEELNEELIKILKLLGINDIKHKKCILENIIVNSSDNKKYFDKLNSNEIILNNNNYEKFLSEIDERFIDLFNEYFLKDFETFDYKKISINNYKNFIQNKNLIIESNNDLIKKYILKNNINKIKNIEYKIDMNISKLNIINYFHEKKK